MTRHEARDARRAEAEAAAEAAEIKAWVDAGVASLEGRFSALASLANTALTGQGLEAEHASTLLPVVAANYLGRISESLSGIAGTLARMEKRLRKRKGGRGAA